MNHGQFALAALIELMLEMAFFGLLISPTRLGSSGREEFDEAQREGGRDEVTDHSPNTPGTVQFQTLVLIITEVRQDRRNWRSNPGVANPKDQVGQ